MEHNKATEIKFLIKKKEIELSNVLIKSLIKLTSLMSIRQVMKHYIFNCKSKRKAS